VLSRTVLYVSCMFRASVAKEHRALSMTVGMLVYMRVLWTENAKFLMNLLLSHPLRRGVTSSDMRDPCPATAIVNVALTVVNNTTSPPPALHAPLNRAIVAPVEPDLTPRRLHTHVPKCLRQTDHHPRDRLRARLKDSSKGHRQACRSPASNPHPSRSR
jgi:hypothetical protein